MKKFYETAFIVNAGLDDEQIEITIKQAEDLIVKNGGEIVNIDRIGRRRLTYPIAKKNNGFYTAIEFNAEGRIIEKIERFYQLDENILRYLTIQLDKRMQEAKRLRIILNAELLAAKEVELAQMAIPPRPEQTPVPVPISIGKTD
jgi:small subunit ribosomal protein S6